MTRQTTKSTPTTPLPALDESAAALATEEPTPLPATDDPATAPEEPTSAPEEPTSAPEVDEASGTDVVDHDQAVQRVVDALTELDAARAAVVALLPDAGYVIATQALYVPGGARAHNRGDRVPVGNVDRNGWQDLVRPPVDGE